MHMRIMYTYIYRLGVCAAQPQQSCNRVTAATELQQSCVLRRQGAYAQK